MDTQEGKILYFFFLSAVLLAIILFVLFRNMIKHYKRMQHLHKELTTIEFETLEKERQRIKADLHDEFAPLLAATGQTISHITVNEERSTMLVNKAIANTDILLEKLRKISFDLIPTTLLNNGLFAAIDELLSNIQLTTNTSIYFTHPEVVDITAEKARHLYRIISEAMHNMVKHAGAEYCNIIIEQNGKKLRLNIVDDGAGFGNIKRGNGLNNIALRTELMKGKFFLNSEPGEGTNMFIEIPI